ncbi:estradiol 17-beta-dehydrogenase 11-like [Toxorhynchites rutilus septentrionalis]|uniref:estradiol 17-beta-dehydrogenase 11-like n=1 Tax=Toxorhynchites rutilus septentrionalis TaxID=329112 RepID=UPI002478CD1E|nr:estradiol 17-beta-dehydrogenase 11-like [Toxorhynchites rutilus septentrionalis]
MENVRDIGSSPYSAAPRGDSLRKLRNAEQSDQSKTIANLKFFLSAVIDILTFLVLLLPILAKYVIGIFVSPKKKSITGQLALVTGGANGLGREICLLLAQKGCHVAIADLDMTNGEKTAEDLRQLGVKAKCFKADISSFDSVLGLKKEVESSLGHVDILVNNAGVLPLMSVREGTPEDVKKVLEINLLAHFWTVRAFVDGMIARRRGHIVAVASAAAFLPIGRVCAYIASKYGVRGMMASFHEELFFEGLHNEVFTTTVYPYFMNTRQDLISTLDKIKVLSRVPIFSPKKIARATVNGMLRNQQHVHIPRFMAPMLVQYENIPCEIRRLATRILLRTDLPKLMN